MIWLDRIVVALDVTELWNNYLGVTRQFGLDYGCLSFVPRDAGAPAQVIASAMPKGWLEGYRGNQLFADDLVVARARASTNSFEWQLPDWASDRMTPAQNPLREHCLTFGITGGLCVLDFHPGEEIMLLLCGKASRLTPHDRMALCFAGHEVQHRLQELARLASTTTLQSRCENVKA